MKDYYNTMHTYHISYAAYPSDYIRGRRYMPLNGGLGGTQLAGQYTRTGLFDDKQWIHVTIVKQAKELWMEFRHPDKTLLCHFRNKDKPPIEGGRIGLRLMPERMSRFKNFKVMAGKAAGIPADGANWKRYRGKAGPTGWRCHVIQPDPKNHGPDGINLHDWDGDGDLDVFVNYEEGRYSRLYFNPGRDKVRDLWGDFIEFKHGKCEDSGIGDLDNDGDIDYVANGGWVYFNPGKADVRDPAKWVKMTLFKSEQRVPTVSDVDGDGLGDLIVGGKMWYKQPADGKHDAANWTRYDLGKAGWAMSCIRADIDKDGRLDVVVADRKAEAFWYVNPGKDKIARPWPRKALHKHSAPMFMAVGDVNADGIDDVVISGGNRGTQARKLIVLLRTNRSGEPTFTEVLIDQPSGSFPKGVAVMDVDGDPSKNEILVIPKQGDIWTATYTGDSMQAGNWKAAALKMPGANTRLKMDNAWPGDVDGDGDLDVLTTEENGKWGVIWFENPARPGAKRK